MYLTEKMNLGRTLKAKQNVYKMVNRQLEILTQRAEDGDMWAISEISKLIPELQLLAQLQDDSDAMCALGLCYDYG